LIIFLLNNLLTNLEAVTLFDLIAFDKSEILNIGFSKIKSTTSKMLLPTREQKNQYLF